MRRLGLALASLLAAAGWSPAASPDPADLEATPEVQVKARSLVRRLGSEDYAEREAAQEQLAALGRLARPALLDGVNASPDPEVRLRCAELLPAASALDLKARFDTFLADSAGRYEHDLPAWKAFRATACGEWAVFGRTVWSERSREKAAREVFITLLAAPDNRRLIAATGGSRIELADLVVARRLDLYRRRSYRDDDDGARDPKLEDVTALLFAESFVGSQYTPRRGSSVSYLLSSAGFYGAARGADEKARVYRALAAAWVDSRNEPREMYQAMSIAAGIELTDQSCAVAARLLTMPGVTGSYRGRAASHLAEYGTRRHLRLLEPALASEQVIYSFRAAAAGAPDDAAQDIQLRDLALTVAAALAGQKPEDFGLADRRGADRESDYRSSSYTRYYFRDAEARKRAFAKWAEWRKANPGE